MHLCLFYKIKRFTYFNNKRETDAQQNKLTNFITAVLNADMQRPDSKQ